MIRFPSSLEGCFVILQFGSWCWKYISYRKLLFSIFSPTPCVFSAKRIFLSTQVTDTLHMKLQGKVRSEPSDQVWQWLCMSSMRTLPCSSAVPKRSVAWEVGTCLSPAVTWVGLCSSLSLPSLACVQASRIREQRAEACLRQA